MRAVLFAGEEPLYLPAYIHHILRERGDAFETVVLAPSRQPRLEQLRRQYRMLGPRAFCRLGGRFAAGKGLDALERLGAYTPARPRSVRATAERHGVPVCRAPDVRRQWLKKRMADLDPDVLLSVVAGQKLPPSVLEHADEAVNLHGSLLPRYRGRAVAFWPLFYGDEETGVTAHRMTDEWDAGPILAQRCVGIDDESMHELYQKLATAGASLAVEILDDYPNLDARPNETTTADYHGLPTPSERRTFCQRGNRFV